MKMISFKLAKQELFSLKRIQIFLVLNLFLGIVGFFILQLFQNSLSSQTEQKAQEILGADFAVSSRRFLEPDLLTAIEKEIPSIRKSRTVQFFGMSSHQQRTRLVQVVAFDESFPLYGKYEFSTQTEFNDQPLIWTDKDVAIQLGIDTQNAEGSQKIKIGQKEFIWAGIVTKDPTKTFQGSGFAPRAFISQKYLDDTKLIQQGSTLTVNYLYQLNDKNSAADLDRRLKQKFRDTTIRFETALQDAESDNRVLKYLTDYLGLVSLVALGLCFLCGGYLLRWIFLEQKKTIAVYKTLGVQNSEIIWLQVIKNSVYSVISFGLSLFLVWILLPALQSVLVQNQLPIELQLTARTMGWTLFLSLLMPQVIAIPVYLDLLNLNPIQLFQFDSRSAISSRLMILWLLLVSGLFWGLAVYQSNSLKIGTIFSVSIIILYGLFKLLIGIIRQIFEKTVVYFPWKARYAILGFIRRTSSTDLVFITMSLSLLVLTLLPHVKTTIISEVRPSQSSQVPSLFLFDIQPEQQIIVTDLAKKFNVQPKAMTPLVRARILKINEQNYEIDANAQSFVTREQEEEARFRNRGINLTYKLELQESEKVVAGKWNANRFNESIQKYPEISLEKRYADRIGVQLGDVLTFDVQGLSVQGQVTSLRQVRWTSFQPNFFIVFQPGVLEEAPQIFLTSLSMDQDGDIQNFQNELVQQAANISIINVKQTAESALEFIDQMAMALQLMAYLSLLVGLFIFVVLLNTQIKERLKEMNLLQILGLQRPDIFKVMVIQFTILMTLTLLSGFGLSFLVAFILVQQIFLLNPEYDFKAMWQLVLVLVPIFMVTLYWGLRPLRKLSAQELIRSE